MASESDQIIVPERGVVVNEVLCYATQYMNTSTREQLMKCMKRFYTYDEILEAKKILYDSYQPVKGEFPHRKSSTNRSELLAHLEDLLTSLYDLDQNNVTFRYAAINLKRIPVGDPSECDYLAIAEKLSILENRMFSLETVASENKVNIIHNKDMAKFPGISPEMAKFLGISPTGSPKPQRRPNMRSHNYSEETQLAVLSADDDTQPKSLNKSLMMGTQSKADDQMGSRLTWFQKQRASVSIDTGPKISVDKEEFHQPKEQIRRQERKRRQIIKGTGVSTRIKGAPPPEKEYFVYRVVKGTTVTDMSEYLTEKNIEFSSLEKVSNDNAKFCSFKLCVPFDSVGKITNASVWPEGISVRRFFKRPQNDSTE